MCTKKNKEIFAKCVKAIMSKMNLIRLQILGQGQMHCLFQNLKFKRFNGDHVHHRTRAFLLVVENEFKPWLKLL